MDKKIVLGLLILATLLIAWAPLLDDQAVHDKVILEKGKMDGSVDSDGALTCEYYVSWVPSGRWVASCEAGYFVTFYGGVFAII